MVTRREFLRGAAAAGAAFILSPEGGLPKNLYASPKSAQTPLDALKSFESGQGALPLSIEKAKKHLNLIAEQSASGDGRIYGDTELLKNSTYFITRPDKFSQDFEEDDFFNYPEVTEFRKNYPGVEIPEEMALTIAYLYELGPEGAMGLTQTINKYSLINLDFINGRVPVMRGNKMLQYFGEEPSSTCQSAYPVTVGRLLTRHEWKHLEGAYLSGDEVELEEIVLKSYKDLIAGRPRRRLGLDFNARKRNFAIYTYTEGKRNPSYRAHLFNEFMTDHIPVRADQRDGLPYTTGYGLKPVDHVNLKRVLEQSGVPLRTLNDMYNHSYLLELYQALALGAQAGPGSEKKLFSAISPPSEWIDFTLRRFPPDRAILWRLPEGSPAAIKPHFPKVEDELISYGIDGTGNNGCILM